MRALVTGGAGFIGSHIVDRFLQNGYEVRILDDVDERIHPRGLPAYVPKDAEFVRASVTDRAAWEHALKDVDVVSHQAAYQDYMLDFSRFLRVNAVSTALLFEILVERRWRPRKVIIASSQAVYGEGQYTCPVHGFVLPDSRDHGQLRRGDWEVTCPQCGDPCTPLRLDEAYANPFNQYAVSKLSGEKMALGLGKIHQIPTVALRYSITQGPRQSLFNQYSGLLRISTARALAGQPFIIYEDGKQTRDFVHVEDVVDAHFCVLNKVAADFQVFNVGSDRSTSVLDFIGLLSAKIGREGRTSIPGEYRVGDNRHSVSSVAKLRKLDWKPQRDLNQILEDFLGWVDKMGGLPSEIRDAHREMASSGVVQAAA